MRHTSPGRILAFRFSLPSPHEQQAIAAIRTPEPHNGLDRLITSIVESGRSMAERYKVASLGGVSINVAEC